MCIADLGNHILSNDGKLWRSGEPLVCITRFISDDVADYFIERKRDALYSSVQGNDRKKTASTRWLDWGYGSTNKP